MTSEPMSDPNMNQTRGWPWTNSLVVLSANALETAADELSSTFPGVRVKSLSQCLVRE
jgi:hypothetical protein